MDSVILKLHEELKSGKITSEELVNDAINKAKNDETNSFVTICDSPKSPEGAENVLSGIPYVSKDNLSTKDILSTGSSNTLKD